MIKEVTSTTIKDQLKELQPESKHGPMKCTITLLAMLGMGTISGKGTQGKDTLVTHASEARKRI
eukprot:3506478-Ditylum_brightwellii.AAC.1